jgi:hypothetical protein
MPCNFWIDKELSQEFSEKNLHAISYSFKEVIRYMSLNRMMKKLFWQYCAYILEFMKTAFQIKSNHNETSTSSIAEIKKNYQLPIKK